LCWGGGVAAPNGIGNFLVRACVWDKFFTAL
jgi:hypothetical protein